LRRTFATLLQETGVPDHDIIAAAGWVDDTTLNYYDMLPLFLMVTSKVSPTRPLNTGP